MKFDEEKIEASFREFWKLNKDNVIFVYKGKKLDVLKVAGITKFQMEPGDFGDGYNYSCTALNARIECEGGEKPYTVEFVIKVIPEINNPSGIPAEKVIAIRDNKIYLKDRI